MSSFVKANWHVDLDALETDTVDLWADEVAETGLPIDLEDDYAKISRKVTEALSKEAYLDGAGITCAIKSRPDTSCWACPVYQGDTDSALGSLCLVGREQERLLTRMAVARIERDKGDDQGQESAPTAG